MSGECLRVNTPADTCSFVMNPYASACGGRVFRKSLFIKWFRSKIYSPDPRLSELLEQNPQRQRAVQQKDQIREKLRIQIQIEGREKIHGHEAARKAKQAQKDDVNHNQNACR